MDRQTDRYIYIHRQFVTTGNWEGDITKKWCTYASNHNASAMNASDYVSASVILSTYVVHDCITYIFI